MAYDQLGNFMGMIDPIGQEQRDYEAEEQRRLKEQQAAQAQQQRAMAITKPVAPVQPQPQAQPQPVAPDATFDRMVQAESNGQQFNPQGGVLTSPKGAQGVAQVMPATAANPGYGVAPATPEEIASPEGNRAFGQRYYQGLLNHFGGDQAKAVAAYNAGPGRVQQNVQQNQGQMNAQQLPQETQGYLGKVLGALNPIGTAHAETIPQPVQPIPPGTPNRASQGTAMAGEGYRQLPATEPAAVDWTAQFEASQADPRAMSQLQYNDAAPEWVRKLAAEQNYQTLRRQYEGQQAQKQVNQAIQTGNFADLFKNLRRTDEEGSVTKAAFYNMAGLTDLAKQEQIKLGAGQTWQTAYDEQGQPALVKFGGDGLPTQGYDMAGVELTPEKLLQFGTGGAGAKADYVGGSVINDRTGQIGRIVTRNGRTMVESGGRVMPATAAWRNNTVGTDLNLANQKQLIKLQNDLVNLPKIEAAKYLAKFNAEYGTNYTYDQVVSGALNQPTGAQAQPQGQAMPSGAPTTGGTGAPTTGAPAASPAEAEQNLGAQKKVKEQQARNSYQAKQIAPFVSDIRRLIPETTGSGAGARVDEAAGFFGYSPAGATAIAEIAPLADKILKTVERFEGPQSDLDVKSYKEAAGLLSDPKTPTAQKEAAFKTILEILKRNAPDVDWDKELSKGSKDSGIKIISREKI